MVKAVCLESRGSRVRPSLWHTSYIQGISALLLVDFAKKIISTDGSIKICSNCLRLKDKTQERIDAFNAGLAVVSAEKKCSFVDNDNYFKTRVVP